MAFQSKIYQVVEPKSEVDSNYEVYEYLLCWYGRNGGFYQFMFTDRETQVRVNSEVINERSESEIRSLIKSEVRMVSLSAEDLTKNEIQILGSLLSSSRIIRLKKDGTFEYVAIESNSYKYRESGGRYNLSFDIKLWNLK